MPALSSADAESFRAEPAIADLKTTTLTPAGECVRLQDTDTFYSAFRELANYITNVKKDKRVQFITLDAHFSHFSVKCMELALTLGFEIIFLPAHMSSRLQPADTGINAMLKAELRRNYDLLALSLSFMELTIPLINGVRKAPVLHNRTAPEELLLM